MIIFQDRLTVQEREREEQKERLAEKEAQQMAEYRRKDTLKKIENIVKENAVERKAKDGDPLGLNEVVTGNIWIIDWTIRQLRI